jgi:prophage antirepressor-like protein
MEPWFRYFVESVVSYDVESWVVGRECCRVLGCVFRSSFVSVVMHRVTLHLTRLTEPQSLIT